MEIFGNPPKQALLNFRSNNIILALNTSEILVINPLVKEL